MNKVFCPSKPVWYHFTCPREIEDLVGLAGKPEPGTGHATVGFPSDCVTANPPPYYPYRRNISHLEASDRKPHHPSCGTVQASAIEMDRHTYKNGSTIRSAQETVETHPKEVNAMSSYQKLQYLETRHKER